MDIQKKLRFIKEGYSLQDIQSQDFSPLYEHFYIDFTTMLSSSLTSDINYIMEVSTNNTKRSLLETIKRVLRWLRDKIMQFVRFIASKFSGIRKGTKQTVRDARTVAKKVESGRKAPSYNKPKEVKRVNTETKVKDIPPEPEPSYEPVDDEDFYRRDSGAIEYIPERHEVTLLEHIFKRENFFEEGFMKVYKTISDYIDRLKNDPSKHEEIISTDELLQKKNFFDKIFKKSLSVEYDKKQVFKKLYGDVITKEATTTLLLELTRKLEKIDYECEVFAKWIQKTLPESLDNVQKEFQAHINRLQFDINTNRSIDSSLDRKTIENLNSALDKIVKLIGYQMSIIQVFATMHAEVFIHLKSEIDNLSWVFEQPDDLHYDDNIFWYEDNDDGIIH